jgi:hypothetical protein
MNPCIPKEKKTKPKQKKTKTKPKLQKIKKKIENYQAVNILTSPRR